MERVSSLLAGHAGWIALAIGLVLVMLLVVALLRGHRRLGRVETELDELRSRSTTPAAPPGAHHDEAATFVITGVAPESDLPGRSTTVSGQIEGRLFADIVVRESVVKAGGLVHGLRRALDPQVRHRIKFEMKREIKRARKERRAHLKAALRDLHARERAEGDAA